MKNVHKRQEQKQAAIFGKPLHFSRAPKSFEERENQYRSTRRTLGEGYFAKVYEGVSKGEVIKVMAFNSVQHASRDPYLHYLAACSAFPDNPYLPKVYAVHLWECSEEGDVWAEIVMEKLRAPREGCEADTVHALYTKEEEWSKCVKRLSKQFPTHQRELRQVKKVLKKVFKHTSAEMDLHDENMMYRHKQLVLTDPVM